MAFTVTDETQKKEEDTEGVGEGEGGSAGGVMKTH